jgi:hypothetical protein
VSDIERRHSSSALNICVWPTDSQGGAILIRAAFALFTRHRLFTSKRLIFLHLITILPTLAVWRWFVVLGSPRRDANGNVKAGVDLGAGGVIELAWDL